MLFEPGADPFEMMNLAELPALAGAYAARLGTAGT